jgi:L-Lysine epsilon oxidase N-terminal/L-lysine epsilon oxidase C-terminal domain
MATTYEIHPVIGIARVGSSREFFIGPEPDGQPPGTYRDGAGDLKRQAARFRIFACQRDDRGQLLKADELATTDAAVTWTVELANRKAAAPKFLDNGRPTIDAKTGRFIENSPIRRNNATGDEAADSDLIIAPGPRSLTGINQGPAPFDTGKFRGVAVPLGEIRTDQANRLIVVGGFGHSGSSPATPLANEFADNDNWYDDTADGPVAASIRFSDGRVENAKPAWVIACQPKFAPAFSPLVTLYDMLYDLSASDGTLLPAAPTRPGFDTDIWPILQRVLNYQWVNTFARDNHGPGGRADFSDKNRWRGLDDPSAAGTSNRQKIFSLLRDPSSVSPPARHPWMPALFSDDYAEDQDRSLTLTLVQYSILKAWASGNFDRTRAVAPELMPDTLTRITLQACVGGAFFPGIEAGRRLRDRSLYIANEPFRLSHEALKAGEVTECMALPWQADFFDCTWEDGTGKGWWPTHRPDDVLLEASPGDEPKQWIDGVADMNELVARWSQLGIVAARQQQDGSVAYVETERTLAGPRTSKE